MKKLTFFTKAALLAASILLLEGCSLFSVPDSNGAERVYIESTETQTVSFSTEPVEINANTKTINILNAEGKKVSIVRTNPSLELDQGTIMADDTQYVSSFCNISSAEQDNFSLNLITSKRQAFSAPTQTQAAAGFTDQSSNSSDQQEQILDSSDSSCYIPRPIELLAPEMLPASRSAIKADPAATAKFSSPAPINPVPGTKKDIYIDSDRYMYNFNLASTTLRAVGEHCYVWVVDGYFEEDPVSLYTFKDNERKGYLVKQSYQLTQSDVDAICSSFDSIYQKERDLFGQESDNITLPIVNSKARYPMDTLNDTGTMVNIVLYDIGMPAVMGYFHGKDYYVNGPHYKQATGRSYPQDYIMNYSNEGKYLYLDSTYALLNLTEAISTAAHEFQHLITYGIKNYNSADAWYSEMLACLGEELMSQSLGITQKENSALKRLPNFNAMYNSRGFNNTNSGADYAYWFAFGSWLSRTYGGIDLIMNITRNSAVNQQSILQAIKQTCGKTVTMESLLRDFAASCTTDDGTFSRSFEKIINGTSYRLYSINLWDLRKTLSLPASCTNNWTSVYDGPAKASWDHKDDISPFGFHILEVGDVESDFATLTLGNHWISSQEKLYIVFQ